MRKLVLILFCVCAGTHAGATASDDFIQSFQTTQILFPSSESDFLAVNPGRYPSWIMSLFQKFLLWKPRGQKGVYAQGCRPEDLYQAMMLQKQAKAQAQVIEDHKNRCASSMDQEGRWGPLNTWKMMSMEFDVHHHALIHHVVFKLPGGTKLKGLLALKGDLKKRPFVIVRLGVFSNVEEFLPERFLLMQLFEQGLANVLVLENTTGADFIANNQRWAIGGYDEGLQNMQVVRLLKNSSSPFSKLISSIHLVGVSLGGHGVLYASLLNEYNHHPIQSFTAFCPVVRLKETLENISAPGITGTAVDYWASMRLEGLQKKIPDLADYSWVDTLKLRPIFLPRAVRSLIDLYPQFPSARGSIQVPPAQDKIKGFWELNYFWPSYRHVESSVLVMATVHDHLVGVDNNFNWLRENSKSWDSNLGQVLFEKGYHCTMPVSYDWSTIASMMNARIMSQDKNTRLQKREISLDISDQLTAQQALGFKNPQFDLSWDNDREILVQFKSNFTKDSFSLKIPVKELDFVFRDSLGAPEQLSVERWLNQNLQVDLEILDGKIMAHIQWPSVL